MSADPEALRRAHRSINAILAALEQETGMLVESISLQRYDASTISDAGPVHSVSVAVVMHRIPGSDWGRAVMRST